MSNDAQESPDEFGRFRRYFNSPASSWQEPEARTGDLQFVHSAPVLGGAIPRTGGILVTLDAAGGITGWASSTGRRLYSRPLLRPGDPSLRLTCSPDGRFVAVSARSLPATTVIVLELSTGKEVRRLGPCFSPTFSPDGEILAGSEGCRIRRWALKSGAELPGLQEATASLKEVAIRPDGRMLAASFQAGRGHALWDLEKRRIISGTDLNVDRREADALSFSPDGQSLWIGDLWGVGTVDNPGSDQESLGGPPLLFSPDGNCLITGSRRKLVKIRDLRTDREVFHLRLAFGSPEFVEVSDGGDLLMRVRGKDVWLEPLPLPMQLPKQAPLVTAVGYTAEGKALIADASGSILRWDPALRKEIARTAFPSGVLRAFSKDGRIGIAIKDGREVELWDLETGREVLKTGGIVHLAAWALSQDRSRLAIGSTAGEVALWDVAKKKELARIRTEVGVTALAWSPDGKTIAWGDAQGSIGFAGGAAGGEPLRLQSRGAGIVGLAYLPDGRMLVSGDRRGALLAWKDQLGKEPDGIASEDGAVTAIACSPDGRWLAAASVGGLRLHPLGRPGNMVELVDHRRGITMLAFSPDGSALLSSGEESAATLWRVPPG